MRSTPGSGVEVWTYRNDGKETITVILEPHGAHYPVARGSTLVIKAEGGRPGREGDAPFAVLIEGREMTVWVNWTGSSVWVELDGRGV